MFIFFSANKTAYQKIRKSQLAPFFIALIAVVIMILLFSINISKESLFKVRTANAADAGALAGASQMAFAFNQLALQAMGMYFSYMVYYGGIQELYEKANDYLDNAIRSLLAGMALGWSAVAGACTPWGGKSIWTALVYAGEAMFIIAQLYFSLFLNAMSLMKSLIETLYDSQKKTYANIRAAMRENTIAALDIAHDYAFLNSGIGEKLKEGQIGAFKDFIQAEGTGGSYSWIDGSSRGHTVTVNVDKSIPGTYQLIKTNKDLDYIEDQFDTIFLIAAVISAAEIALLAGLKAAESSAEPIGDCSGWVITICIPYAGCYCIVPGACTGIGQGVLGGILAAAAAAITYEILKEYVDNIWDAVQEDGTFCNSDGDTKKEILVTITDIDDNREIGVSTNQLHEGKDLGLWQTNYPEVKSNAIASYACDNSLCTSNVCNMPYPDCDESTCGNICGHTCSCVNGEAGCLAHQPQLISAH